MCKQIRYFTIYYEFVTKVEMTKIVNVPKKTHDISLLLYQYSSILINSGVCLKSYV